MKTFVSNLARTPTRTLACALVCLFAATHQAHADEPLSFEIVRQLDARTAPGNIAVSESGRVFMSTHLAYSPEHKIVELLADGSHTPYPKVDFFPPLNGVLGSIVDAEGIYWFLDTIWGKDGMGRVIGWDTNTESLYKIFYVARPLVYDNYILNDLAVDRTNNAIYITETASATTSALLVIDIDTGLVRRVLEGSFATIPEDIDILIDDEPVVMGGENARIGVNPITIDVKSEWVYFAPMSAKALYRARTADLSNAELSADELLNRVERYADKPAGDGITMDSAGNIYVSDLENNAIGVIDTNGEYQILFSDDEVLSWVEGLATAGDDGIYATTNKLHLSPAFANAEPTPNAFYVIRFKPLAFATPGR